MSQLAICLIISTGQNSVLLLRTAFQSLQKAVWRK